MRDCARIFENFTCIYIPFCYNGTAMTEKALVKQSTESAPFGCEVRD